MTEREAFERLAKRYPSPAYILLPQVRNGVGFKRKARTADAVAVSVWPSRGLTLTGIEIKVTRSDWLRELAKPTKAEALQTYCHYWYVAAPPGVVELGELPETWGLIQLASRNRELKKAPKTKPAPPDILLLASILRKASEVMVPAAGMSERIEERATVMAAQRIRGIARERDHLRGQIERFEEAAGIKIPEWGGGNIGEAVRVLQEIGVAPCRRMVEELNVQLKYCTQRLDKALEVVNQTEE